MCSVRGVYQDMPEFASPFAAEFRSFAEQEAAGVVPRDAILFYGSSSIRLWSTLTEDFAGLTVVNRGFGGSTLEECAEEVDRLVVPLRPRAMVFYAGENDLDHGATPEEVIARFNRFASSVRSRVGLIPMIVLTIKPSPSRMGNIRNILRTNELLRAAAPSTPPSRVVDVFPQMVDAAGNSDRSLFGDDWLHLSAAGYRLWTRMVREALEHFGLMP